jgi:hypothetical protein
MHVSNQVQKYAASVAPSRYSSYASAPPVSQIHVPAATVLTSPTSIRSTYSAAPFNSYSVPAPTHHNTEILWSSASTTMPMTTSSGVQLQQLSMVNMQGRRMAPYVRKPANTVTRASSAWSGPNGHSNNTSQMTRYV